MNRMEKDEEKKGKNQRREMESNIISVGHLKQTSLDLWCENVLLFFFFT